MTSFQAKDAGVLSQQQVVQKLTIPFTLTASASSASVVLANDCPGILFLKSLGNDQITPELLPNETASYTTAPSDTGGTLDALLVINEPIAKVVAARVVHRNKVGQTGQGAYLGSATGITTGPAGGTRVMIAVVTGVNHTTTSVDAVLEIEYSTTF